MLKGLTCFHVDDVMISGPGNDPEFKRMMDKVKRLHCGTNENSTYLTSVVAEFERQRTSPSQLIRKSTLKKKVVSRCLAHRRKHMSETSSAEEHATLMAKRGRAGLVSETIHESTAGTF